MHKSEKYGTFAIKDKDRISDEISDDFARVFTLFCPFDFETVRSAFRELLDEGVVEIYRNEMRQKRMVKDGELSEKRAVAGNSGAISRWQKESKEDPNFAIAKPMANGMAKPMANEWQNAEYEYEIEIDIPSLESNVGENEETTPRARAKSEQRHKHGKYGRVLLSDKEHEALLRDLGQEELSRCIAYIDESAQMTGNKNRWKDWCAVIRKCSREGWAKRNAVFGQRGTLGDAEKRAMARARKYLDSS
jgi:hypothetical protein